MNISLDKKCPICGAEFGYTKVNTGDRDIYFSLNGCVHIHAPKCHSVMELSVIVDSIIRDFKNYKLRE